MKATKNSESKAISQGAIRREQDSGTEPVAIVGIGCRFPGAGSPLAFWQLIRDGGNAIGEIPPERFDVDSVYDVRPGIPGKLYTRYGGFLENVDQFDPYFFGISPREAAAMDPQQRLLLEVAWEALEDAGQLDGRVDPRRTGVFVGMCNSDYAHLLSDPADIDIYTAGGIANSILSGRLSYALGFEGPSLTLDTACSTSLVAVHLACQSLAAGESTLALAGGVNLILLPHPYMGFCSANMLAPDGQCKFGDARADGFVRSEGAAIVVLKLLSAAIEDKDDIYAVIMGSAVSNDGRSGGLLMTPSTLGQQLAFRNAYRNAGISPGRVQYVECHGTGTSVGDPIELQALAAVVSEDRSPDNPVRIGSVKTNIGHTEAAAGVAGLIKVALALKHHTIPPSLHFEEPNPNIPWQDLPLVVQQEQMPWPDGDGPALAGVSSFGISGTNAHVVVQEAPSSERPETAKAAVDDNAYLLPLSARNEEALRAVAARYRDFLQGGAPEDLSLRDICYTASLRRTHHDFRLAATAHSLAEMAAQLNTYARGEASPAVASGRRIPGRAPKVAFVFSGQGSQWAGMGRSLYEQEPVYRQMIDRCDEAMRPYVGWSLREELERSEADGGLQEVDIIQPALFAVQVALAALWRSWGIEPAAVVGQSLGEVAAAYVAGALSLEDAARVICQRSQLAKLTSGLGRMAVVGLTLEEARRACQEAGNDVSVAVSMSPSTTVISGAAAALESLVQRLEAEEVICRWINVDYASHSPLVEPLVPPMLEALNGVQGSQPSLPIYSTVTGDRGDALRFDASYWARNMREPVLFSTALQRLLEDGYELFVEVSPHPLLLSAIGQWLLELDREGTTVPSLHKDEGRAAMLTSLGALHNVGLPVNWKALYPHGGNHVRLPSYPWQHERFWLDFSDGTAARGNGKGHLLGQHLQSATATGAHFWEINLSTQLFRYLNDHRVQGAVVFPAAAYVEMALAAASQAFGKGSYVLQNLEFKRALFVPERGHERVQLIISPQLVGDASFELHSLQGDEENSSGSWLLHAKGNVRPAHSLEGGSEREPLTPEELMARFPETVDATDFYPAMSAHGLQYGPAFQGVERIWRGDGEALGKLLLTEAVQAEATAYEIHPALLDACFQVLAGALATGSGQQVKEGVYLPTGLRRFRLYRQPGAELWVHALFRPDDEGNGDVLTGDLYLLDHHGDVVLEALGFRVQRVERTTAAEAEEDLDNWLYTIRWEEQMLQETEETELQQPTPEQAGSWLIFADHGGVANELQRLLEERGESCTLVTAASHSENGSNGHYRIHPEQVEEFERLFGELAIAEQPPWRGVIHLWSLDIEPPQETTLASLDSARQLGSVSVLHTVQALAKTGLNPAPQLWLVTAGSQAPMDGEPVSSAQAPVWGLGKVISFEHPELRCKKIDLSSARATAEVRSLFRELWAASEEDQVALRGEQRFVPRLVRAEPQIMDRTVHVSPQEQAFRLEIPTPGILDNFILRASERRPPSAGEVEIQVKAVGMNFRDVMIAMDLLPPVFEGSLDVGFECAGVITAVGEGVDSLQPGDEVVAGAPACFGSYVTAPASMVSAKPAHLTFEEAATIPIAFLTAYYALVYLGRLRKGERVLIHAASGGVGQAAVQIAQHIGAEIFATAGSDEKRAFLKAQGIEHVMNSRTLEFAEEVMRTTDGEGIDMVLNSLAGEFIPKGISILRAGGRFLEIGKVDILQNSQLGLQLLDNNIAFFAIDLSKLIKNEQQWMTLLWNEAMAFFAEYELKPLPLELFPISNVVEAFRHMAQARHIGKVVISMDEETVEVTVGAAEVAFDPDATYLITGGAGGLGLAVARWMVERGARHLALLGRSGASEVAQEVISELQSAGAQIELLRGDVSQREQMAQVLDRIRQTMPPLKGIIHSAGVLDDGILLQQTPERFQKVMAPKVEGAWNLHSLTLDDPIEQFVLFSSGASVLGSPGQGNYVAANAFLDALAHQRRALGLPATAINWGAWAEVGLATRADRVKHLTQQGIVPFSPEQGVELLGRILARDEAQLMAVRMEWANLVRLYAPPFLTYLAQEAASEAGPSASPEAGLLREKLLAARPEKRQRVAEEFLKEQMAKVLRSAPAKIDIHQPLTSLGIDSLMAVELKNRVETEFAISVPVTALLQGPTLAQLAAIVLEQLTEEEPAAASELPPPTTEEELLATIDQLSDEEVDHLLEELLDEEEHEATHSA